jgi:hypothetical protein
MRGGHISDCLLQVYEAEVVVVACELRVAGGCRGGRFGDEFVDLVIQAVVEVAAQGG